MFNKLMIWVLSIRMNRILNKITAYKAIPHTSGYSKSEGDRRIELLTTKYNFMNGRRALRIHKSLRVRSKARVRANMITAGVCVWALVILVLMAFAGKVCAAEPTDAEVEGITTFIDTQFGNVCYIVKERAISCVALPKE